MAELRGGTTIAGYTALHSGLQEAYLYGNLTMGGKITLPVGGEIWSQYNNNYFIKEHSNGSVTLSAAGGQLFLGYQNTSVVRLTTNLVGTNGSTLIADTSGKLYYQGNDADVRYVRMSSDPYIATDLSGNSNYPRLVAKNSGASTPQWLRVGDSTGGFGILPYANGSSSIGTSTWRFKDMHAVNFYEDGTALSSKYASSGHNHDSAYVSRSGDSMSGVLNMTSQNNGVQLNHVSGSSTPSIRTSGNHITGGSDYAGLSKLNNVAIQTWYGFSVSPTISGQGVAQGTPAFSVNARTGDTFSAGSLTFQGNYISSSYGHIIRASDSWLRINEEGNHSNGIYFGSSVVRTDGEFQLGSGGSTIRMTSGGITLNGTLNFSNTNGMMKVEGEEILSFLPDNYGRGVIFGGNQSTYIVAGDGSTTWSKKNGNGDEGVFLVADNYVNIAVNANNATPSWVWNFRSDGRIKFPSAGAIVFDEWGNLRQDGSGTAWKIYGSDGGDNITVELGANGQTYVNNLRIRATGDLSETGTSHGLQIGPDSGSRLAMDTNEIMSLNGSNYDGLYITASDLQWDQGGGGVKLARIRYGTGGPPSSNAYNGDIYVQY